MQKSDIQKRLHATLKTSPVKNNIKHVSIFGSFLHGNQHSESDIDLLIEFTDPISMFALVRMERELSDAFGKKVDLCTPSSLSRYFRNDVVREAEVIYAPSS